MVNSQDMSKMASFSTLVLDGNHVINQLAIRIPGDDPAGATSLVLLLFCLLYTSDAAEE